MASIRIDQIVRTARSIRIERGGGHGIEIPGGLAELKEWVRTRIDEADPHLILALALARLLKQRGDLRAGDTALIEGKTITFDPGAANILEVSP